MLPTVEAEYSHGHVTFKEWPEGVTSAKLLVTVMPETSVAPDASDVHESLAEIRRMVSVIPRERSLVDELIAERRREAARE